MTKMPVIYRYITLQKIHMHRVLILLIFFCTGGPFGMALLSGQGRVQGRVIDAESGEPLAFVNIVYNQKGTGTTTSLDGFFIIDSAVQPEYLKLSYVGYEPLTIYPSPGNQAFPAVLALKRRQYLIDEVIVKPGINPAHRIIEEAFRNRRQNDPRGLHHFHIRHITNYLSPLFPIALFQGLFCPDLQI
jgi:hypothetical protein